MRLSSSPCSALLFHGSCPFGQCSVDSLEKEAVFNGSHISEFLCPLSFLPLTLWILQNWSQPCIISKNAMVDRRYLSFALYLFNTILKMLMYTCSKLVVQAVRPHFFRKASKCSYQRYFLRLYPVPGPSGILSGHVLLEGLKKENTSAIHLGNSTRKILRLNIWTLWPRIFF